MNYILKIIEIDAKCDGFKRVLGAAIRRDNTNIEGVRAYVIRFLKAKGFHLDGDDQRLRLDVDNQPDKDGRLPVTANWNPDNLTFDFVPPDDAGLGREP